VLLGVALGNVIIGVPIDRQGNMYINLLHLLNPYSIAVGLTAVVMLCLHGGIFLTLKTEDELLERVKQLIPRLMAVFFVLMTVLVVWTLLLDNPIADRYADRLWIGVFPFLALIATLAAWRQIHHQRYLSAFLASATTIALLMGTVAAGLYPVMLPSSTDPAFDLTVHNAASAEPTLQVMTVIAVIGMPFVLLYTAGVYYFFRGRVVLDDESY
jgi:cytochrome d ubiquinol oxidase subunit II